MLLGFVPELPNNVALKRPARVEGGGAAVQGGVLGFGPNWPTTSPLNWAQQRRPQASEVREPSPAVEGGGAAVQGGVVGGSVA